jgi:tape measure domain-containing protein
MANEQIQIQILAQITDAQKKLAAINAQIQTSKKALAEFAGAAANAGAAADGAGQGFSTLGAGVKLAVGGKIVDWAARGASSLANLGLSAVKAAARMEQTRVGFATLMGGAAEANKMLEELYDFASRTPFDLPGVLDGAKRLMAMGFSAGQVIPSLTAIGDAAAGLGLGSEGIHRLTLALGQMAAKGKVSAEEVRQLAEAGIPAWQMLADKIGVSIPQAMKLAENNAISAADGLTAIVAGMQKKFGGMMQEQSKTVGGLWQNLEDEIGRTAVKIGEEITDALDLKTKLKGTLEFFQEFREKVERSGLAEAVIASMPAEEFAAAVGTIAAAIMTVLIPALAKAKAAALALKAATIGIGGVIGVAVTGVAALGAYKYAAWEQDSDAAARSVFEAEGEDPDKYSTLT